MNNNATKALDNKMNTLSGLGQKISGLGKFPSVLLREFHEHKTAFFTVPMVISALTLLALIVSMTVGNDVDQVLRINQHDIEDISYELERLKADEVEYENVKAALKGASVALAGGVVLILLPFILIFPLLNCLYDERQERSYLFWKSMPVSDAMEVGAKFVFITLIGPFILFAIAAILGLIEMIVLTPYVWSNINYDAIAFLWSHMPVMTVWLDVAALYIAAWLWMLPLFGWLMLASSIAPKAPLLFAVVPPAAIAILEQFFHVGDSYLMEAIGSRFESFVEIMDDIIDDRLWEQDIYSPSIGDAFSHMGTSLAQPGFWMGTAVAAAFLVGAVYVRKFRA